MPGDWRPRDGKLEERRLWRLYGPLATAVLPHSVGELVNASESKQNLYVGAGLLGFFALVASGLGFILDSKLLILTPAMRVVGDLWAAGEISIADEHLATSISFRIIALQHERFRVAASRASKRVLLAAVEGERHILGLEMAASALTHAGYDVRMLGADVPSQDLGPAVARHEPAVVGLTMSRVSAAAEAHAAIAAARDASPAVGVLLGGVCAPDVRSGAPGVAVCAHVSDVLELTDALAQRADSN